MCSCSLVKYSISESSDFKDSVWEIIFRAHNFFFKVHLSEVRSLAYCRIIDYIKYFELTQCFSSQHFATRGKYYQSHCKLKTWGEKENILFIQDSYQMLQQDQLVQDQRHFSLMPSRGCKRPFVAFLLDKRIFRAGPGAIGCGYKTTLLTVSRQIQHLQLLFPRTVPHSSYNSIQTY